MKKKIERRRKSEEERKREREENDQKYVLVTFENGEDEPRQTKRCFAKKVDIVVMGNSNR